MLKQSKTTISICFCIILLFPNIITFFVGIAEKNKVSKFVLLIMTGEKEVTSVMMKVNDVETARFYNSKARFY